MREHLPACSTSNGSSTAASGSGAEGMSYWVLLAPSHPSSSSSSQAAGTPDSFPPAAADVPFKPSEAEAALVAALLARPCPPFACRCSEMGWLRGVAGDVWRAVRKSADVAAYYSRLARTQYKGAGGWGLAR